MCPGIHLAERNQWRIAAKILWAFDILEPTDPKTGKTISLDPENYIDGLLHTPMAYKVIFKPRSQGHVDLINREFESAMEVLEPYKSLSPEY